MAMSRDAIRCLGSASAGAGANLVKLIVEEWNILVRAVKAGTLDEVKSQTVRRFMSTPSQGTASRAPDR